jgi:hypothetical protein
MSCCCTVDLEKAVDLARLGVDIDVEVSGCRGKARDGLDVGGKSVPESC